MTTPAAPGPSAPDARILEDATCLGCGLLCDDIALTVSGGRILDAARACDRGRSWFLSAGSRRDDLPPATVDGRPVTLGEAIARAASLLVEARAPVVAGLTSATVEAQGLAALIADRVGAAIGPAHAPEAFARTFAVQRAGGVFASFGEVINRADLVLLWGVDPATTHPRLRERLIDWLGRFVPEGRAGRTVLVVDAGLSECRAWADGAIAVPTGQHAGAIQALRAAVRQANADPGRVERQSGWPIDLWRAWAALLTASRYGAVLFGAELAGEGPAAVEAIMRLLDDLSRVTRFVGVPLAGPGNPSGAEAIMTGRLGAPLAIDLADGTPRYRPLDADPSARIRAGEADAVLVVGDPPEGFDADRPEGLPAILIGPDATGRSGPGVVAICCATPGIDEGGTVFRSDEVALPLRPAFEATRPRTPEVLRALLDQCV